MNIFVLSESPREAAQAHLDKHVVRMILEYGQLLSTAHRVLDGLPQTIEYEEPQYFEEQLSDGSFKYTHVGDRIRAKKALTLPGEVAYISSALYPFEEGPPKLKFSLEYKNRKCYNATHVTHPCAVWARETDSNYRWLYDLFQETSTEYTHRYGKVHKTWRELYGFLKSPPKNIRVGERTPFALAMADEFKDDNAVQAYRRYYLGPKAAFAKWTNRAAPDWFKTSTKDFHASNFERTTAVG